MHEEDFLAQELATAAKEFEAHARFVEWLADQSDGLKALAAELFELQDARKMPHGFSATIYRGRHGQLVYEVRCANGQHQSNVSHEHALELMVESFRTRIEDQPETHAKVLSVLGLKDIKQARYECDRIAKRVLSEHPDMPGHERDVLVRWELEELGRH